MRIHSPLILDKVFSLPYTLNPALLANGLLNPLWKGSGAYSISAGKIINTPTLGDELVTNGDMGSATGWSLGAGWSIGSGIATAVTAAILSRAVFTSGLYKCQFDMLSRTAGNLLLAIGGTGYHGSLYRSTVATHYGTGLHAGDSGFYLVGQGLYSGTIDNASAKAPTISTTIKYINCHTPLVDVAADWTLISGTISGVVACVDSTGANGVYAWHDGSATVFLMKRVAETWTSLLAVSVAYVAGATVRIKRTATSTFQLFYNGVQRGADQTVSDATITINNNFGLFSTHAANTCSSVSLLKV